MVVGAVGAAAPVAEGETSGALAVPSPTPSATPRLDQTPVESVSWALDGKAVTRESAACLAAAAVGVWKRIMAGGRVCISEGRGCIKDGRNFFALTVKVKESITASSALPEEEDTLPRPDSQRGVVGVMLAPVATLGSGNVAGEGKSPETDGLTVLIRSLVDRSSGEPST